ncbi:hypothetical protein AB0H92_18230 [Streptomyces phaeochromogenes]|uniref:hypothetical protein n=1 Tax=Streptomyces phaeochromogenes TaxID=1923 RepID=UPI00340B4000
MRTRLKTGALLGAVAMGVTVFTASPASAATDSWTRTCNGVKTQYDAYSSRTLVYTQKTGSSCAGHAWVRVKTNGTWKSWLHNPSKATISNSTGNYQGSQHKGCETCTVYTL